MSNNPAIAPRISLINPSTSVSWSDGSNFTGYYLFELKIPSDGTTSWAELDLNVAGVDKIPIFALIPIIQGVPNANIGLFYNEDINPPTTQYVAYLYDAGRRQLAGPSSTFTVSGANFVPPALTATIPNTYAALTTPDVP